MPGEAEPRPGFWASLGNALRQLFASPRRFDRLGLVAERHASQRALTLLRRCLDESQRAEFERTRGFVVRSPSGRRYRITYGTTANIDLVGEGGEILCRLCARPLDVPAPAVMLAQKLMLESEEAEFLRLAARHEILGARQTRTAEYLGI
jgi:hypothetical protein